MESWECKCGRINRERDKTCGLCRGDRNEVLVDEAYTRELRRRAAEEIAAELGYRVAVEVIGAGRPMTLLETQLLTDEARRDAEELRAEQRQGWHG